MSSCDMDTTSALITTMSDIKPNHFLSYIMSIRIPFSHGIQTGAVTESSSDMETTIALITIMSDIKPKPLLKLHHVNQNNFQSLHSDWGGHSVIM